MNWRILHGDVRERLAELPAGSVQTCVTSPPYWGLRDYGTATWDGGDTECDHKSGRFERGGLSGKQATNSGSAGDEARGECPKCGAKRIDNQIGLEPTPEAFVASMVAVFREVRRVLRDDATLWLNLGDSYANDTKWGGSSGGKHVAALHGQTGIGRNKVMTGLKAKDLVGIPWRVAFALQADGWYLRSDIIWSKPNPMPESVTDRPTKAHEYIFLLSKSARYYYDAAAISEAIDVEYLQARWGGSLQRTEPDSKGDTISRSLPTGKARALGVGANNTRNKRSVWHVATQPYPDAHFATYPEKLIEPCILAGTSEKGQCPACGKPWVRVTERQNTQCRPTPYDAGRPDGMTLRGTQFVGGSVTTTGWQPSCACDAGEPVPQTVLDPFTGSGTTGAVSIRLGRSFVGCELNADYIRLAERRIGAVAPLFASGDVA